MESRTHDRLFVSRLPYVAFRLGLLTTLAACAGTAGGQETVHPAAVARASRCEAAILIYHEVRPVAPTDSAEDRQIAITPQNFARQMRYLHDAGNRVVPYGSVVDCVERGVPLPQKAVVITFDDSEVSPYLQALPVMRKYGFTATFFITSNFVGRGYHLSWDQIRMLRDQGMTIGAHSRSHPSLTKVRGVALLREVAGSKADIERNISSKVDLFAYPNGRWDDVAAEAVRAAGFRASRCSDSGSRHVRSDLFAMRAFNANDDMRYFRESVDF